MASWGSVGTKVEFEHGAAAPVGATVRVETLDGPTADAAFGAARLALMGGRAE